MGVPAFIKPDPLSQVTQGLEANSFLAPAPNGIALVTWWLSGDIWTFCCDPVTTGWTGCFSQPSTSWSHGFTQPVTSWTEY